MGDAEPDERSVSADGIAVRKSLEAEQFRTPAIVFDVRSERSGRVRVQVREAIPDEIAMEDIGFHPDYGAEYWTVQEREVVFERAFDPDEEYMTLYGVRSIDEDEADALLTEPVVEIFEDDVETDDASEEVTDLRDLVSEEDSQAVRDVIAGERDTLPGLGEADAEPPVADEAEAPVSGDADPQPAGAAVEADDSGTTEEAGVPSAEPALGEEPPDAVPAEADDAPEIEKLEPEDDEAPARPPTPDAAAADEDRQAEPTDAAADTEEAAAAEQQPADDGTMTVPVTGGVARVLAKELREGNVSESDRREIREALAYTEGSTEARIKHLQNQIGDLVAYTDALEAFLDENGMAHELLDEVDEEIRALADSVADVEERVSSLHRDVSAVEDRYDETLDAISDLEDDVAGIENELARIDALEDEVDRIDELQADIDALGERQGARIEDLERTLGDVSDLATQIDRVTALEAELEEVRAELADVDQFRERLSSALGAAVTGEPVGGGEQQGEAAESEGGADEGADASQAEADAGGDEVDEGGDE